MGKKSEFGLRQVALESPGGPLQGAVQEALRQTVWAPTRGPRERWGLGVLVTKGRVDAGPKKGPSLLPRKSSRDKTAVGWLLSPTRSFSSMKLQGPAHQQQGAALAVTESSKGPSLCLRPNQAPGSAIEQVTSNEGSVAS